VIIITIEYPKKKSLNKLTGTILDKTNIKQKFNKLIAACSKTI
jgi:hypothetical protein